MCWAFCPYAEDGFTCRFATEEEALNGTPPADLDFAMRVSEVPYGITLRTNAGNVATLSPTCVLTLNVS